MKIRNFAGAAGVALGVLFGFGLFAEAEAACNFVSFWSGGCNTKIVKALTPPPPSKWLPKLPPPPSCGRLNQRPCTVVERFPSCKDGLTESIRLKKCITTPAGKLPFFSTLGEMADLAVKAGKQGQAECLRKGNAGAKNIPSGLFSTPAFKNGSTQRLKYVGIGFGCAAPRILDTLSALSDVDPRFWRNFEVAFNQKFNSPPCAKEINPVGRVACAIGMMVIGDTFSETVCVIKAMQSFPDLGGGSGEAKSIAGYNQMGEGIFILMQWALEQYVGKVLPPGLKKKFKKKANKNKKTSGKPDSQSNASTDKKMDRVLKLLKIVMKVKAVDKLYSRLQRIPECKGVVGQGLKIGAAMTAAVASIPQGSEAAVKPGTLYMVNKKGQLLYFRHNEHAQFTVSGKVIGQGWNVFKSVSAVALPNGGGGLYVLNKKGTLLYYEHDANFRWKISGKEIGWGWGGFKQILAARKGVIYVVDSKDRLVSYRHDWGFSWKKPVVIGQGWSLKRLISGGTNAFYAVRKNCNLSYYYHNNQYKFVVDNKTIGNGWCFKYLTSSGNGTLYAINSYGDLLFYRHGTNHIFVPGSGRTIGVGWGNPGKYGLIAAAR